MLASNRMVSPVWLSQLNNLPLTLHYLITFLGKMENSKKKILLISYHFPPSTAIGGMRIGSFARYLPDDGWDVTVLTLADHQIEQMDLKRLESYRETKIYTAAKTITIKDLYLKVKSFRSSQGESSAGNNSVNSPLEEEEIQHDETFKKKLKYLLASLIVLPDEERSWILPAFFKAIKLIRQNDIDYILTSCPPYSVHLIGLLISYVKPSIKWIADFRDPWMVPTKKKDYPTTRFSDRIDSYCEKKVIQRADLILTTTEILRKTLVEHFSSLQASKFCLIPNGYEEEIEEVSTSEYYEKFTIIYTGALYFGRTPEPVFKAIAALVEAGELSLSDIRIKLVGHCREVNGVATDTVIERYNLETIVEIIDQVPQQEAFNMIKKSHVALLLAPEQPYQIPAKIYEYLGLGKKILAITGEGATADLIHSIGSGEAVQAEDIGKLKGAILSMVSDKKGLEAQDEGVYSSYTRRKIVSNMVKQFDSVKM